MLIRETARALARDVYVERRLFEMLGGWSIDAPDADAAALFGALSRHHGWRAQLLAELQPVLHDLDGATLAPSDAFAAYLDAAAAPSVTAVRLSGLVEVVLPERLDTYAERLRSANDVADAPVVRALGLVTTDGQADWRAASAVLRSLVRSESDASAEAAHQSKLTDLLAQVRSSD